MSDVKILISCHKETEYIKSKVFQPIQLGCEKAKGLFVDMLHDNDGDNISKLNPMYCELTAQYWAWKNLKADYYGFCHYRRYFNLSDTYYEEDIYGNVIEKFIGPNIIKKYALDDEYVEQMVENYDVIVTERKDVTKVGFGNKSIIDQWLTARLLKNEDIFMIQEIIDDLYPEYSSFAKKHLQGTVTSFCNMYILKKDIFFDYCNWLFAILNEFCKRRDMSTYSTEALRTPGHLAERLFGIYYLKLLEDNPSLRVKEVQCVWFENTEKNTVMLPAFSNNSIPIAFASSNEFVPMFSACFKSLIDNISDAYNYDVVVLESDISAENKMELKRMINDIPNVSLRFFDIRPLIAGYDLKVNNHIKVQTYYRFVIQDVFPKYNKVLYLDCDIIIKDDVSKLYNIDLDGYMLAAAHDPDFVGQYNGAIPETKKYCDNKLKLINPYNYFQAGVLLFNEFEMRKAYTVKEWLEFASVEYKYLDQDVLNLKCENKVKFFDMEWNLLTNCDNFRIPNIIVFAPDYLQKEYQEARKHPKIIHYAGGMKPWHRPTEDFGHEFWEYSRKTPFYEELIFRMSEGISFWQIYEVRHKNWLYKIKEKLRPIADVFFPKGTARREWLKTIVGRQR